MKILTVNFLTCAIKSCKSSPASFPLHFKDAELEQQQIAFNPKFIQNILPRIDWEGLKTTAAELGFTSLPTSKPEDDTAQDEKVLRDLHTLLLEMQVTEGKLVCGNCGHEYAIKEGIANFLLPNHLGEFLDTLQGISGLGKLTVSGSVTTSFGNW
ncbi:MAG: type I protein arginine N-methyltransferase Rmt1 [Candelina mexicana]|nr:MAG: type I protein arginine N-methyltransferase Rmt1 [Candelina mexicana]